MSKKEAPKKEEDKKPEAAKGEGAEGAEGAAPKKSKKKLIIIVAGAVVLIGIIVGGLFAGGVIGGGEEKKAATSKDGKHAEKTEVAKDKDGKEIKPELDKDGNPIKPKPIFFDMPDLIVNLNSTSHFPHFVNLKMTLEISSAPNLEDVKAQLPRITDSFNTYLREVRREDLQGSAGTYRLKKELSERLNKILGEGVVNDVLIREIIVQ